MTTRSRRLPLPDPSFLQEYRPHVVIAMHPMNYEEIRRELDRLGTGAELVAR